MTVTATHLNHLAELAYLEVNPETTPHLIDDLRSIINFVEQLKQIDTQNIQPLKHPMDMFQPLRPDEAQTCHFEKALGDIAPDFKDNLYWVPKVIK